MKHVKLFEDFIKDDKNSSINEARKNPLVESVLAALENTILEMLDKIEVAAYIKYGKKLTQYDRELFRLEIIFDLLRSLEIYTLPTDTLISVEARKSRKGNIEIYGRIQRDSQSYFFETEVIIAGGFNIQRAHYRYLTKTTLPKTGNTELTTSYSNEIKRLKGAEKINIDISRYESLIEKIDEYTTSVMNIKTDEQIINLIKEEDPDSFRIYFETPSWEEIVRRGADKNFDYSEDVYNKRIEENKQYRINVWKKKLVFNQNERNRYLKEIAKLRKKLENFIS